MPLSSNELARRDADGRIEFRSEPLRARLELANLHSSDQHEMRCAFECSLRVAETRSDRDLLCELFLSQSNVLSRADLIEHLARRVRPAAEAFVAAKSAEELLSADTRGLLAETIRRAADSAGFACGLIVLPPYSLDVESPSLQRQKLEQMQRARAEDRAAGQVEHLRHAGELLRQFQSIRDSGAGIAPGQVLEQIAATDRGSTLEALLLASARQGPPQPLYAVAGPFLVRFDVDGESSKCDLITLPTTLGPLRSVTPANISGKSKLLIGARAGVMLIDPAAPNDALLFAAASGASQLGFNQAVVDGGRLHASHGDYGIVSWDLDSVDAPAITSAPLVGARHLIALSPGVLACAVRGDLLLIENAAPPRKIDTGSTGDIIAVLCEASRLFVVHEDGAIATIDRATRELIDTHHRGGNLCAAALMPWLSSVRLLLGKEDGAIECVGPDDPLVTQYLSPHRTCKMLAASGETIAAVSADRQRLVLWRTWEGRKPFADIHLTAQTRHRIADVRFG